MKEINETQLRKMVKEELMNEFFGFLKKRKNSSQTPKSQNSPSSRAKEANKKRVLELFDVLRKCRNEIMDINSIPQFNFSEFSDRYKAFSYLLEGAEGFRILEEEIFPLVKSLNVMMKESASYKQVEYSAHIGNVIAKNCKDLVKKLHLDYLGKKMQPSSFLRDAVKEHYESLPLGQKREIEELIMFVAKIYVYSRKNQISQDVLKKNIDELMNNSSNDATTPNVKTSVYDKGEDTSVYDKTSKYNPSRMDYDDLKTV